MNNNKNLLFCVLRRWHLTYNVFRTRFLRRYLIFIPLFLNLQYPVFNTQLKAQTPEADFTANIIAGCNPLTINFIDLSTNNPTSWSWDFGDGQTSMFQNPSIVYFTSGIFTVTLTATNANGSDVETKVNYINVSESPTADFTTNVTNGCDLTIQFTDLSDAGSSTITTWDWAFDDGNSETASNPAHTYSASGTYNVSLTVTTANNCSNTINNSITVNDGPNANFAGVPNIGCSVPFNVGFSDLSSQGSGAITSWSWSFGDGSPVDTNKNPSHAYTLYGSYDVSLIVSDINNCFDTVTVSNYVVIEELLADFAGDTTISCPDLIVTFTDSTSGNPSSWFWDFGDGSTSTVQNPVHTYDSSGIFTVTLIANASGCVDTVIKPGFISFEQPVAGFIADSMDNCELPFTVNFTNNSTGPGPLQYFWDFDDGSPVDTNINPSHTYTAAGTYMVSLVVIDAFGCTDTMSMTGLGVSILIVEPVANFTAFPLEGCIPLSVTFGDLSTNTVGTITNWDWNFGDPLSGAANISTLQNPAHTYDSTGDYSITLIITTDRDCADTITMTNYLISGSLPDSVYFLKSDTIVCFNNPVQFTDLSIDSINNWFWDFGDGGTSTLQDPIHAFQDTGWLMITLIAGFNGCNDTSITDSVYSLPPKPGFSAIPSTFCSIPQDVDFTDLSWDADSWQWDFGDGSPVDLTQNPVHTYTAFGFYTVKLIVSNANGCVDSISIANYVKIPEINSGFTVDDTVGCFTVNVNFSDTSYTNSTIIDWLWYFGDGDSDTLQIPSTHTYSDTGTYNVTLITTETYGCTDTLIMPAYITVNGVFPDFDADTLTGCVPLAVNFSDSSKGTSPVATWSWDFGDTSPADTNQNPPHTYTIRGLYNVQLTATDSNGCTNTLQKNNYIIPTFPYAIFSNTVQLCINEEIGISNTSTGTGLTYLWDFGDSNSDTVPNPIYAYADSGTFTITLTATDINGCDSAFSQQITVIPFPAANFNVDSFISDCPPLVVTFTDISSAVNDNIVSWYWDFGDGVTSVIQNPVHSYSNPGKFDVTLVVTNSTGCVDTLIIPELINVGGPSGSFTYSPSTGCTPLEVTFNATVNNTIKFEWVFGDGASDTLSGDQVTYTYPTPGNPTPALSMTDTSGCTLPATAPSPNTITVDQPVASFVPSNTALCNSTTVTFLNYSYTQNTNTSITNRYWDFGDGDTSILLNPSHSYTDTGAFIVSLTIVNSIGCTLSISDTINVFKSPNLLMSAYDLTGCIPFKVQFYDSSEYFSSVISRAWDFGDASAIATNQDPVHTFWDAGYYDVVLVVAMANGCIDTISFTYDAADSICKVTVPNVFTPNGDGINDIFNAEGSNIIQINGIIINRWGAKIYEWNRPRAGWEGRTTEGVVVNDGVYFYIIKVIAAEKDSPDGGEEQVFTGTITLIR